MNKNTTLCIAAFLFAALGLGSMSMNPHLAEGIETPQIKEANAQTEAAALAQQKIDASMAEKAKELEAQERRERATASAEALQMKAKAEAAAKLLAEQKASQLAAQVEADAKLLAEQKASQLAAQAEADAKALLDQKLKKADADAALAALEASQKVEADIAQILALHNINFNTASDVITKSSIVILDKVATELAKVSTGVEIQGHTDKRGDAQKNQALSEKRAHAVKAYLITKGITADRLTAIGYGAAHPLVDATTSEANTKNRRVEFKLK